MSTQEKPWMSQLEAMIQEKNMLTTPFYQAWTRGHLEKETLQTYAKEYYHHVKAFPTYLSAVHSRCEDQAARRVLLENLVDEEAGHPNHPELWREFAIALGVSEEDLDTQQPGNAANELIATFRDICCHEPVTAGIAALYCYESQIPLICTSKIDGLKKWYGMDNPEDYKYFTVHETADVVHAGTERQLLLDMVKPEEEKAVLESAQKILDTLWKFLGSFHSEPCPV